MSDALHFFPGMGFRPGIQVMQRDQYGDKPVWIVGDDLAYLAKFDPYSVLEGYGWGTWLPDATAEATGKPLTAGTAPSAPLVAGTSEWASVWRPIERWDPGPVYPCRCIEVPPVAPVPVPASAGLLLLGLCILVAVKRRKSHA